MSFLGWFYAPHHPKTISAGLKKLNHLLIILSVIKHGAYVQKSV
jgi:hypothetical protein